MGHVSPPTQAECCLLDLQHMSFTVPLICLCLALCSKHWGMEPNHTCPQVLQQLTAGIRELRETGTHSEMFCRDARSVPAKCGSTEQKGPPRREAQRRR